MYVISASRGQSWKIVMTRTLTTASYSDLDPRIEMKGQLEDWQQLTVKFGQMRDLLQELDILPIEW